ncbi:TolC family outer membrane protein [Methylophilus sp.]|uniref:TolC family outer membrane protein n=1 Tax=Methylophilus sp. TaxID=29541 RepID=UPI0040350B02
MPVARLIRYLLLAGLSLASSAWTSPAWASSQSLLDIYQEAKANDPQLASAGSANQAAQEIIEQAKAGYRPSVNFLAGASANRTDLKIVGSQAPFPGGRNNFEGYQAQLQARQPIFRKENLERIDQSKVQVSIADKQYHLAQQGLMLRTTQAYFDMLLAQDRIKLIDAQKKAIQRQLQQARATFEVGSATITDVNEAQARYDLIAAQELSALNEIEIARRSLQSITGKLPEQLAAVREDIQVTPSLKPMQEWQDVTNASNLNIQIQQETIQVSEKDIEIARAGHYPSVDAVASYQDSYSNGGQYGFGSDLTSASIGVEVSIPLYQGGAATSRVRQAAFNRQKAVDDLQNALRQTTLETQRAYLNLNTSIAQVKALEQALKSSQSQMDSTQLGYEVGIRTSVDVLNAQQQYFSANRDLLQARYNYLVNIIRLKTASGIVSEADLQDIDQQLAKK